MLMFIFSRLLAGWFTFLLPSYSTFKALRQRPLNEQERERWAGYWIIIGGVVAFEYTAEWLLCWFPFYWEIKTLFLLFLSLPQF
jgi:receptor expression-enhancing protein 1/2/3/4